MKPIKNEGAAICLRVDFVQVRLVERELHDRDRDRDRVQKSTSRGL